MRKSTNLIKVLGAVALLGISSRLALAAGTDTWGGGTDANWGTAANWSTVGGSTPPANGDSLVFNMASTTALNNNISSLLVNNFNFNSGASSFTIGGNAITLTGTLTDAASVNETLNGVAIGAGVSTAIKNTGSGTLALGALTQGSGATGTLLLTSTSPISTTTTSPQRRVSGDNMIDGWVVIDNGNNTYDWANSGAGGGTIAAATYAAGSTGNAGNVRYQSGTTSFSVNGSWVSINLQGSGTILNINGTQVYLDTGGIILSGGAALSGSAPVKPNNARFYVYVPDSGTINNSGGLQNNGSTAATLVKSGAGTLTLSAAINKNAYTGGTMVYQGALTLANGGQQGEIRGALTIYPGATVNLNAADALGWDTVASGTTVPTVNIIGGTLNNGVSGNQGFATTFNLTGGTMTNSAANTGTQGFNFNGSSGAINSLATNIVSTIYSPIALRADGLTINTAQGTVSSNIDLNVSGPIITSGGNSWTKAGAGTLQLSGANTFAGTLTISTGTLQLGGGSLANTAITFSGTGTFGVKPGSSTTINAGTTGAGTAGATLNLGGQTFDMGDSATSTFNLQQNTSFASTALTIATGATLKFDLGGSTTLADLLAVTKAASVSGTVNVTVNTIGSTALSAGTYNIITAASGLNGGTWQFTGGGTKQTVTLGGTRSNIHLNNASTAVSLTVANAYAVTYNGNGNNGGSVPTDSTYYDSGASVTAASAGTMTKSGYTFTGWNTQANGSGTAYSAGASFNIASDTTLYAQWQVASATITAPSTFPAAVSTTYGTASSAQSVAVSGANLTANITATATMSGLEISSDGVNYGTTATFTQSGGNASGTLYVRLATNAPVSGSYNSQIVSLASAGATTVNVTTTASGNAVAAKSLTVTGAVAQNKLYDGGTTAVITGGTLVGVVGSDNVTLNLSGTFSSSAVGGPYTVTSTSTLGGTAAGNYTLTQPTGLSASILGSAIWTNTLSGLSWSTAGNWSNSIVATNVSNTADFSQVDITVDTTVNLDQNYTIGNLVFGNTDSSPNANWFLTNNTLTLAGTTPTVTVGSLGTGKSATISSIIAGTSGLTKTGNGTLTLSGVNTFSGATTISAGRLTVAGAGQLGSGAYSSAITDNGVLNYNSSANQTLSGTISGSGSLTNSGSGTLTLAGASSTFGGGATITAGQVTLGAGSTGFPITSGPLGTGTVTLAGGKLQMNAKELANNLSASASTTTIIDEAGGDGYLDGNLNGGGTVTLQNSSGGGLSLKIAQNATVDWSGFTGILNYNVVNGQVFNVFMPNAVDLSHATFNFGAGGGTPPGSYSSVRFGTGTSKVGALSGANSYIEIAGTLEIGDLNQITTFSGAINTGTLTKVGSGALMLSGANTYTGNTTINAGTLALGSSGSINNSPAIGIAAGATFDVSAISSYSLSSSTTLSATGAVAAATIKGASSGTVNLGSRPIVLTYDGSHPALTISQGTLSLNGNAFTVNTASALGSGNYTIVQQSSGNITSNGTFTVSGTAIDSTHYGTVSVSAGNVILTVAAKPMVTGKTYSRAPGVAVKIYASDLAATATVDSSLSYTATFDHCDSTTLNGATLGSNGQSGNNAIMVYPGNAANSGDSFSYTINDGHGGTVSGTVSITINNNVTGQATINLAGQAATLSFFGVPGYHYVVQRSVDSLNNWQDLTGVTTSDVTPSGTSVSSGVITAPSGGAFTVTDPSPPSNPTSVYYQLRAVP